MSDAPPPAYNTSTSSSGPVSASGPTANDVDVLPPDYTPPSKFVIGATAATEPLVDISEIKGHLALLHSFAELKKKVQSMDVNVPHVPEDKDRKWTWFVGLAVERFDVWCRSISKDDSRIASYVVIPPVDVVMVWHAYMLNPRRYTEDCMRVLACKRLKSLELHFRNLLLDLSLLSDPPAKPRVDHWRFNTELEFDLLEDMKNMTKKNLLCPMCNGIVYADYMNAEGTGYLQHKFTTTCNNTDCTFGEINKEKLALEKLARELATETSTEPEDHLAGTLFTSSPYDAGNGHKVKKLVCDSAKSSNVNSSVTKYTYGSREYHRELYLAVMQLCKYSLNTLRIRMGFSYQPQLVGRIMSAYNDEKIYSVELAGAVLRQGSFVDKMYNFGWTEPGFFDGYSDELALEHARARYHAFLDLMSSSPSLLLVPTLDIDLVWHTHQLNPEKYKTDCVNYVKRFVDHDDKIEGVRLSSAFDITCRAWKERYGIQYTLCGCPVSGDTIGQRLSRVVKIHSSSPPTSLTPISRPDVLSATHPSDHNAVRFLAHNEQAQRIRTEKYDELANKKRKEREELAKKAAKTSPGETVAAKLKGRVLGNIKPEKRDLGVQDTSQINGPGQDERNKSTASPCSQGIAFLVPVPIEFGEGVPFGPECVAVGGSVFNSVGGCGSGCGAGECGGGLGGGIDSNAGQSSYTYQLYPKIV